MQPTASPGAGGGGRFGTFLRNVEQAALGAAATAAKPRETEESQQQQQGGDALLASVGGRPVHIGTISNAVIAGGSATWSGSLGGGGGGSAQGPEWLPALLQQLGEAGGGRGCGGGTDGGGTDGGGGGNGAWQRLGASVREQVAAAVLGKHQLS